MIVQGTVNKKLIAYVERVYNYLGLAEFEDCLIDFDFRKECAGGASGYCDGDDEMINVEIGRQDAVGRIPMKDLMINIAHELVHAKQMASGRLVNDGFVLKTNDAGEQCLTSKQTFEGVEYIGVAYDDHPWEHEAYGTEEEIYLACK